MTSKKKQEADLAYISDINGRRKSGKSRTLKRRFSKSQYNQGMQDNKPHTVYICPDGWTADVKRYEKLYKRFFYDKLIKKSGGNGKEASEWISEEFPEITCEVIKEVMENAIRSENLNLRRVKEDYLRKLQNDSDFIHTLRENIEKYTDPV